MKAILLALSVVLLAACASKPEPTEIVGQVDTLYNKAMTEIGQRQWAMAINTFNELERQYPYSQWATRAQLMTLYANFAATQYEEAIAVADRFIRLHPGHKDLAYAYYMRGLSHYHRISDVKRDQGFTKEALAAFQEVVQRFPDSVYARDAALKVTLCQDHLAAKEMHVGRFYQQQKKYMAAINRYQMVVTDYPRTAQAKEALYRITESYLALGVKDEAQRSAAILGHNYPDSDWYRQAYALLTGAQLAPAGQQATWWQNFKQGVKDLF